MELNAKFRIEIGADPVSVLEAMLAHEGRVIRIHSFLSETHPNIITQPLCIEDLEIAFGREVARAAMDSPAVERDTISRLHAPAQDIVILAMPFNIRKGFIFSVDECPPLITFIVRQGAEGGLAKFLRPPV